ncbi:MAG: hypothetical protein V4608_09975 [Bacteroidota bacterium]
MKINLKDPNDFTIDNLRKLIASEDDSVHTQFRVTTDGYLFLSRIVGNQKLDNIAFRLETNGSNNGYVGKKAASNDNWVNRVFKVVSKNWPQPSSTYIDDF